MGRIGHIIYNKSIKDIVDNIKNRNKQKKSLQERDLIIQKYLKDNAIRKLHIGCGPFPIAGWLNTDLNYNKNVALLDAGKKFPLEDNSIDFIYSEHLFEHLTFEQAMNMLKESMRVLKKGGIIRIATPNLDFLLGLKKGKNSLLDSYIVNSTKKQWNIRGARDTFKEDEYNEVFVINNFFKDWGHQIIHNFSSLELMLRTTGFANIKTEDIGKSRWEELQNIEQHGKQISNEFNQLETIIVEAEK